MGRTQNVRTTAAHRVLGGAYAGTLALTLAACSLEETGDDGATTAEESQDPAQDATDSTAQDELPEDVDEGDIRAQSFVSRPDLNPPEITFTRGEAWEDEYAEGGEHFLVTPSYGEQEPDSGAMILDASGELVWMAPSDQDDSDDTHMDLRVQQYQGEPVITSYRGPNFGWGFGEISLLDQAYEEVARVTTGGSLAPGNADFHDTTITPEDTMLIAAYVTTPADLSPLGGPRDGYVRDGRIQEVDIDTGEVLFDWSALEHIPVTETMAEFDTDQEGLGTEDQPFDYFHINSITEDDDGSLLVSARHTHAVYQLERDTGEVNWTLGGSASDFELGQDVYFAWQHDAQRSPDGTLTLFDNRTNVPDSEESSRGLRLALDEEDMTASVVTEYDPPQHRPSGSMANAQEQPDGNMFVGWGQRPYFSEHTHDGRLIYDAFHGGGEGSYRAYKAPWEGRPSAAPDAVLQEEGDERTLYVSWNGATEVDSWRLVTGEGDTGAGDTHASNSFETRIPVLEETDSVTVEALDADGGVLATVAPEA